MPGSEYYDCPYCKEYRGLSECKNPTCKELNKPVKVSVEGKYDQFKSRVRWFYHNHPECLEARKYSFSLQSDVAFTLAMNEYKMDGVDTHNYGCSRDGEPLYPHDSCGCNAQSDDTENEDI